MPFTPVIPSSGLVGWNFLKSSQSQQIEIFERSPNIQRDVNYFLSNIGDVETLDDFMSDRRLQKVALGAFGLGDEISKGAFVRKVLEEGTTERTAFAVRLNNPDYLKLAKTFIVKSDGALSISRDAAEKMAQDYKIKAFEIEVGEINNSMRLSLNFKREIAEISAQNLSEDAGWFTAMASVPIRKVLEGAFSLPEGFSQLDLDRQKELLADNANRQFGKTSVKVFQDPDAVETAIRKYLLREQLNEGPSASTQGFAALSLLSGGLGITAITNLLLSNS